MILAAYERRRSLEWLKFEHGRIFDLLANNRAGQAENRQLLIKREETLADEIREILTFEKPLDPLLMEQSYKSAWELNYGRQDDPAVQRNIEAVIAAMRAARETNALRSA